jgi:hypothetical protein
VALADRCGITMFDGFIVQFIRPGRVFQAGGSRVARPEVTSAMI